MPLRVSLNVYLLVLMLAYRCYSRQFQQLVEDGTTVNGAVHSLRA